MKIVTIIAERLYAFRYNEGDNEFDRLLELWTDINYLKEFAQENSITDIKKFIKEIQEDEEQLSDLLYDIETSGDQLETFFTPLHDSEILVRILSEQKGKINHSRRSNKLRIYALKIDEDCYVITGGAIKMSQAMQEHILTAIELEKIKKAKTYLQKNGVFDKDSFDEFKTENL